MDDGYAPREGAYQSNNKGDGLHASGDSSGALNELADPFHQVRGTRLLYRLMWIHMPNGLPHRVAARATPAKLYVP